MSMSNSSERRNEIGGRLRKAREAAGLSQAQVAELIGLHRPTISEIEAGRRRVAAEELAEFADIYEVTVEWLAGRKTEVGHVIGDLELAARELDKLSDEDREKILSLLSTLGRGS